MNGNLFVVEAPKADRTGSNSGSEYLNEFDGSIADAGASAGQTRYSQVFLRDVPRPGCATGIVTTCAVRVAITL